MRGFVTRRVTPYPHAQRAGNDSAPFSLRGKEKAAGGKKKTPKGDFDFPLWNPLKTTKKGVATPFLDFSQEFGCCKGAFKLAVNAMQMRIRQTGEVVEILCDAVGRTGNAGRYGHRPLRSS